MDTNSHEYMQLAVINAKKDIEETFPLLSRQEQIPLIAAYINAAGSCNVGMNLEWLTDELVRMDSEKDHTSLAYSVEHVAEAIEKMMVEFSFKSFYKT